MLQEKPSVMSDLSAAQDRREEGFIGRWAAQLVPGVNGRAAGWLALILLLALALRLWGVGYDLPYIYHPDEPVPLTISLNMFRSGQLNPHFFHWSSLLFYLDLLAYIPYYLAGRLAGVLASPAAIPMPIQVAMGVTYAPMPTVVLWGRLVTVAFGVGIVWLAYLAGRQLFHDRRVGLLAAFALAVSPPIVTHSRWMTPDIPAAFFVMGVLVAAVYILQRGQTRYYVAAGALVGLAAGTKYNAVLIALAVLAAHLLRRGKLRDLLLAGVTSVAAFCVAMPYAVLDYPAFREGLRYNSIHYSSGHPGMEGDTIRFYLNFLWTQTGLLCLLALLAAGLGVVRRSKLILLLAVFPLVYAVFIGRYPVRNDRTGLLLIPFIALLAAALLVQFARWISRSTNSGGGTVWRLVWAVLVAVCCLAPAVTTVRNTIRMVTPNSRETARVWLEENLPEKAKVAVESYAPYVDPQQFNVQGFSMMIANPADYYRDNGFEYMVYGAGMFGRFVNAPEQYPEQAKEYQALFDAFTLVREFDDGGYRVLVYRVQPPDS